PTKVDRSAAYGARWAAKNVVAAGLASRCEVQVAYAIGIAKPVSVLVETFGTERVPVDRIATLLDEYVDLSPFGLINALELRRPTVERVLGLGDSVHIVTAADQAELCLAAVAGTGLDTTAVIAEPEARGTGPALALATAWLQRQDPGGVIASVHADHRVGDSDAYRAAVLASAGWAAATDGLATVGLVPASPATG